MKVCVAITADGEVDPRWGWADRVAVADVTGGQVRGWQEFAVSWEPSMTGAPRALIMPRIARFLRDNQVQAVAAQHVGPGMERMLGLDVLVPCCCVTDVSSGCSWVGLLALALRCARASP